METDHPKEKGAGGGSKTLLYVGICLVVALIAVGVFLAVYFTVIDDDDDSGSSSGTTRGGSASVNVAVAAPNAMNNIEQAQLIGARAETATKKVATQKDIDVSQFAADSDYVKSPVETFMYDQIQESVDTINDIMCHINQAGFGFFVPIQDNRESDTYCYGAKLNSKLCEQSSSDQNQQQGGTTAGGSGGQQQGQNQNSNQENAPDFIETKVCVTNFNDEAFVVRFELELEDEEEEGDEGKKGVPAALRRNKLKPRGTNKKHSGRKPVVNNKQDEEEDIGGCGDGVFPKFVGKLEIGGGDLSIDRVGTYLLTWSICCDVTDESTCSSTGFIDQSTIDDDLYDSQISYWQGQAFQYDINGDGTPEDIEFSSAAAATFHSENEIGVGVSSVNDIGVDFELDETTGEVAFNLFLQQKNIYFAYDADHVKRSIVTAQVPFEIKGVKATPSKTQKQGETTVDACLDRVNVLEQGYDYRVFDSMGDFVYINTGESIYIEGTEGELYYGYASVFGIYGETMEDGTEVFVDGATVYVENYDDEEAEPETRTIKQYPGEMYKQEYYEFALADLDGYDLNWDWNSIIHWDDDAQMFIKTHELNDMYQFVELDTPVEVDLTALDTDVLSFNTDLGWLEIQIAEYYWNETTWEYVSIPIEINSDTVIEYEEFESVHVSEADEIPTSLICQDWICFDTSLFGTAGLSTWELGHPAVMDNADAADLIKYTFDRQNYVVKEGDNELKIPDGSLDGYPEWMWMTMVEDNAANNAILACENDNTKVCPNQVSDTDFDVKFIWSSGQDTWSRLTVLLDSEGEPTEYDHGLFLSYTHSGTTSNSGENYDGNKFTFDYWGYGLYGLPTVCLDINQQIVDCWDWENIWHVVDDIFMPAGSLLTDVDTDEEYVVKSLVVQQTMLSVDAANCADLELDLDYPLASVNDFSPPDAFTFPAAATQTKVIGGFPSINCTLAPECNE